jgi:hypothetical protein
METSDTARQRASDHVREPVATIEACTSNQLMSKHRVLSFKPQLRLDWRDQDGPNVTEQPNHSVSSNHVINSDEVFGTRPGQRRQQ